MKITIEDEVFENIEKFVLFVETPDGEVKYWTRGGAGYLAYVAIALLKEVLDKV